ncbi:M48 family metallopeptidase [Aquimarina addita]|uniref:M48 family metallopeptidase n=1 Tax=Aquimarina addita TaxID=870485 RepID=A0ABP7X9M5_9FLAO
MRQGGLKISIFLGLAIVVFASVTKCSNKTHNPYTDRAQDINISTDQEIAIGLQSAPEIIQQYGGLYPDKNLQDYIDRIGNTLVNASIAKNSPYKYEFHLLADPTCINTFTLPGGQIFITYALLSKLDNEDQVAGILGHEIGHVLGRHSAERIAKHAYWKTISANASVDTDFGSLTKEIDQNVLLDNSRLDELESDKLAIQFMINAGYNPQELIEIMKTLKNTTNPNRIIILKNTHPNPENKMAKIRDAIKHYKKEQ